MLKSTVERGRIFVIDVFNAYLSRFRVSGDIQDWIHTYWEHLEQ